VFYQPWFLIVLLLIGSGVQAGEIRAAVDRNPINLNDSFRLTFSADAEPDGKPDFTPLEQNFEIINQQRSSNASWVNGKSSRTEQWVLHLIAKQSGEVLIPPIAFGSDSSQPLKITVTDKPSAAQSNDDLFLQVEATPEQPYVQSQVLYTLRLYRRVQITQASLSEPEIKDALVEKLGEDSTYSTQVKGVDYWVTERKYAIFPQQSGVFTIAPLTLTASVVSEQAPRFNGFFNRQVTETRRVTSKAITLNVQAVPNSFTSPAWLSAESLSLEQSWSDDSLQSKVGEPLTRTITLSAKGATVGQLPELAVQPADDGLKSYPDQPLLKEDKLSDGLTAIRQEKIAYIPGKAGEYTLPALEINWFNTQTQQVETARLPAVTLKALPGGETRQTPVAPLADHPVTSLQIAPAVAADQLWLWQTLSAGLAVGWLLTLVWFNRARWKKSAPAEDVPCAKPGTKSAINQTLKNACRDNKPQAAQQALLQWGKAEFAVDSLAALTMLCQPGLADEIRLLNQYLYSAGGGAWHGQNLWQAFANQAKPSTASVADDGVLEPLYKIR